MKYKVHKIEVKSSNMQEKLEDYLNKIQGEVVSVIPNVRPTFQIMGATAKIDSLFNCGTQEINAINFSFTVFYVKFGFGYIHRMNSSHPMNGFKV